MGCSNTNLGKVGLWTAGAFDVWLDTCQVSKSEMDWMVERVGTLDSEVAHFSRRKAEAAELASLRAELEQSLSSQLQELEASLKGEEQKARQEEAAAAAKQLQEAGEAMAEVRRRATPNRHCALSL